MRRQPNYIRNEEGAAAVEFALVGTAFILTLFFIMATALVLYINQMVDNATVRASRQILTGGLQSQSTAATLENFKQSAKLIEAWADAEIRAHGRVHRHEAAHEREWRGKRSAAAWVCAAGARA